MRPPPPLLLIPTVSVAYCLVVLALPGSTTAPPAYRVVRDMLGGDSGLAVGASVLFALHLLACFARGRARTVALFAALSCWAAFGTAIVMAAPNALLPGLTLGALLCCAYALHDSAGRRR